MSKQICMLAHLYDPERVIFPAYIQPKLDGVRAIWKHKEKMFVSRNNKPLVLPLSLIHPVINAPFDLDGEILIPGKPFNEISGIVRHQDMIIEKTYLKYIIFDIISDRIYTERKFVLSNFCNQVPGRHLILTDLIYDVNDIDRYHKEYLSLGYEGSIIRNDTLYEFKRSFNLLKLKPQKEIICKIIDMVEGTGKYEGTLGALTVETPDKKIFNVGSGFTDEERDCIWKLFPERYDCIQIKVKYQDLSEYGIPRFPIFKGFKE